MLKILKYIYMFIFSAVNTARLKSGFFVVLNLILIQSVKFYYVCVLLQTGVCSYDVLLCQVSVYHSAHKLLQNFSDFFETASWRLQVRQSLQEMVSCLK